MARPSVRGLLLLSIAAGLLAAAGSAGGSTGTTGSTRATAHGVAGAAAAACLAHVAVPTRVYYAGDCSGHDEPELDPVSSAPGSARDITWRVMLPAGGLRPGFGRRLRLLVRRHSRRPPGERVRAGLPGGAVLPRHVRQKVCTANGGVFPYYRALAERLHRVHAGVDDLPKGAPAQPAGFNAMAVDTAPGTGPLVMHGGDTVDVHIFAASMSVPLPRADRR